MGRLAGTFDPAAAGALRRARKRQQCDAIIAGAEYLSPDDSALLRAVYADGRSSEELSALIGVRGRAVRRRVQRLTARIASPLFVFVVSHLESWPTERRDVAAACILRGRSQRAAAGELGMRVFAVRRELDVVLGVFEASGGKLARSKGGSR